MNTETANAELYEKMLEEQENFRGWLLGQPDPAERLAGTVAASLFLADRSVEIIRVHDVRQVCDALKVREKLLS